MEKYQFLLSLPSMTAIGLLGMITHFLKKQIKGETPTEILSYFKDHFRSTLIAVISTVIGVVSYHFTLAVNEINDPIAAFGIGYTFDSIFNKWETTK